MSISTPWPDDSDDAEPLPDWVAAEQADADERMWRDPAARNAHIQSIGNALTQVAVNLTVDAARTRESHKQSKRAWARIEKQWEREGFDPREFLNEFDKRRPNHPTIKAALLDVAAELGTTSGTTDDDNQHYRNLRERLNRAREYVQRGSPN